MVFPFLLQVTKLRIDNTKILEMHLLHIITWGSSKNLTYETLNLTGSIKFVPMLSRTSTIPLVLTMNICKPQVCTVVTP